MYEHPDMSFSLSHMGETRVSQTEFVADVFAGPNDPSGFFTSLRFPINPGLNPPFPLASVMYGPFYKRYRCTAVRFRFQSTVGLFNTQAAGTVMMAYQRNPSAAPFESKRDMERSQYFSLGTVQQRSISLVLPCSDQLTNMLLVRTEPVPAGHDPALYDMGAAQISLSGVPAALGLIGELWIDYDIIFDDIQVPIPSTPVPPVTGELGIFDGFELGFRTTNEDISYGISAYEGLGALWLGAQQSPSVPLGPYLLEQYQSTPELATATGWALAAPSTSPSFYRTILSAYKPRGDIFQWSCIVSSQLDPGGVTVSDIQLAFDIPADATFRILSVVSTFSQRTSNTNWRDPGIPPDCPKMDILSVNGPAVLTPPQFCINQVIPTGNWTENWAQVYEIMAWYDIVADATGGPVVVHMRGRPWRPTAPDPDHDRPVPSDCYILEVRLSGTRVA